MKRILRTFDHQRGRLITKTLKEKRLLFFRSKVTSEAAFLMIIRATVVLSIETFCDKTGLFVDFFSFKIYTAWLFN